MFNEPESVGQHFKNCRVNGESIEPVTSPVTPGRLTIAEDPTSASAFHSAVEMLRTTIHTDVQRALDAFKAETGVMPSDVTIHMVDVANFGTRVPEPVLAGVHLEFKF